MGCFRWNERSVTPPSKILLKYRGIKVLPMAVRQQVNMVPDMHYTVLTVSLGSIFQAECKSNGGIIFKELSGKGIPPQVVTVLLRNESEAIVYDK